MASCGVDEMNRGQLARLEFVVDNAKTYACHSSFGQIDALDN